MKQTILIMIVLFSTLLTATPPKNDKPPYFTVAEARERCIARFGDENRPRLAHCIQSIRKYGYIL